MNRADIKRLNEAYIESSLPEEDHESSGTWRDSDSSETIGIIIENLHEQLTALENEDLREWYDKQFKYNEFSRKLIQMHKLGLPAPDLDFDLDDDASKSIEPSNRIKSAMPPSPPKLSHSDRFKWTPPAEPGNS